MTQVYDIIVDAYRQSNLIGIGIAPTVLQETEGLRYLNRIVKGVLGFEVGDPLEALPIGRNGFTNPPGYPFWEELYDTSWFIPKNTRLILNLTKDVELALPPNPEDGTRFGFVDASKNLSTNTLTIKGNGATIGGVHDLVLNENGASAEYFYRADLADWKKYAELELFDEFPFPSEFDDFFILSLAFRMNPAYQRELDPQSHVMLNRAKVMIKARYSQIIERRSELALIRSPRVAADRDQWRDYIDGGYHPNSMFNLGRPW